MKLPIPEKVIVDGKPSVALKSIAIITWSLVLASVLAGLLYYVGIINQEKRGASRNRQNADLALVPALELVDDYAPTGREERIQEALKIVRSDVLKIDPSHAIGLKLQRLIQDELSSMQDTSINKKDDRITETEGDIKDLARNLKQALSDITKLEKDKVSMQKNLERAQSKADESEQEADEARQEVATAKQEAQTAKQEAQSAKQEADKEDGAKEKEIEELKKQVADLQKRIGTAPIGQPRTRAK